MFSPLVFVNMLTVITDIMRTAKPTDTTIPLSKYGKSKHKYIIRDTAEVNIHEWVESGKDVYVHLVVLVDFS